MYVHGCYVCVYVCVCVNESPFILMSSVPPVNQRLRAGFPPKELKPGSEPDLPVQLANGERVQVDVVNIQKESSNVSSADLSSAQKDAEKGM